MSNQAVPLHLTQTETPVSGPALRGLAGEHGPRASGPGMDLVHHHVLQLLVVDGTEEDVRLEGFARDSRGHAILALVVEAALDEIFGYVLHL